MKLNFSSSVRLLGIALVAFGLHCSGATATQLDYEPISPTFGGDPNNPDWIAFSQHAQNRGQSANSGGQGLDINLPDFEELFKNFDELPTIIIPVF